MIKFETVNETGNRLAETIRKENLSFEGEAIVFIGALGICVRKIIPYIKDKYTDPAVVCVDSTGRFVIPVLSGHIGGANELARRIANITGGEAVITTQSDNTGLWPLDTIGRQFGWKTKSLLHEEMNRAIATFVNKQPTALLLDYSDEGTEQLEKSCPKHVVVFHDIHDFTVKQQELSNSGKGFQLLIIVSPRIYHVGDIRTVQFYPPCLNLGMGCQKNTPSMAAQEIVKDITKAGFAMESVRTISSIVLKKDEQALKELDKLLPWASLKIYSVDTLAKIEVPNPSIKVFEVTGCYGVAEASALSASHEGELVAEKQKGRVSCESLTYYYTWALAEDNKKDVRKGHIEIVGAGPGAPDLIRASRPYFICRKSCAT